MQLCHHSLLYYSASLRSLCNVISTCCARGSILLPTSRTVLSFTRNMSSSPTKHLFAIHAPDYTEPGTLDRRTSAREEHLKGIKGLKSSGIASMCSLPAVPPTMTTFFFLRRIWGRPLGARTGRWERQEKDGWIPYVFRGREYWRSSQDCGVGYLLYEWRGETPAFPSFFSNRSHSLT